MKLEFFDRLPSHQVMATAASLLAPAVNSRRLPRPFLLTFVVTRRCNSRCRMCNIWQEKDSPFLSLEQIQHIFRKDDFSFIRQVGLTGGEPTLRSDLPELFEIVRAACPNLEHVEMATSGLNTRRTLDYVERMLESIEGATGRINRFTVQVSLDGVGDMHDYVRGIPGFYSIVRETLEGLGQLGKRYSILRRRLSCVVMPENLGHVESLRSFAQEQGLPIIFSPAVVSGKYYRNVHGSSELTFIAGNGRNETAVKTFQSLAGQDDSALGLYYEDISHMLEGAERGRTCMMGFYGFTLEHEGSIYPCVNFEMNSFGNLLEQSFDDVWFGPQAEAVRKDLRKTACPTCVSACYTSPQNAGEMIKLIARRVARPSEPGSSLSTEKTRKTQHRITGMPSHMNVNPQKRSR